MSTLLKYATHYCAAALWRSRVVLSRVFSAPLSVPFYTAGTRSPAAHSDTANS